MIAVFSSSSASKETKSLVLTLALEIRDLRAQLEVLNLSHTPLQDKWVQLSSTAPTELLVALDECLAADYANDVDNEHKWPREHQKLYRLAREILISWAQITECAEVLGTKESALMELLLEEKIASLPTKSFN